MILVSTRVQNRSADQQTTSKAIVPTVELTVRKKSNNSRLNILLPVGPFAAGLGVLSRAEHLLLIASVCSPRRPYHRYVRRKVKQLDAPINWLLSVAIVVLALYGCTALNAPDEDGKPSKRQFLYDYLFFEIAPVSSSTPDLAALEHFRELIDDYGICKRQNTHFIVMPETPLSPAIIWTMGLIHFFESQRRTMVDLDPKDRTGIIFISYLRGPALRGTDLVWLGGVQYSPSAFTIFKGGSENREGSVLLHELGHLIGLRKNQKQKPKHHCPRRSCIMYPSVGSPYAKLCWECKEELGKLIAKANSN